MKIFDFSNGKKGAFLAHATLVTWCDNHGGLKADFGRYEYHTGCGNNHDTSKKLEPSSFGVEAICFCLGEFICGDSSSWEWCAVGSVDWALKTARSVTDNRHNCSECNVLNCYEICQVCIHDVIKRGEEMAKYDDENPHECFYEDD